MKDGKCPKCGSKEIMANVTVNDVGHAGPYPLRVEVQEPKPPDYGFLWTPQTVSGEVRAWICSECGFTELYTNNLKDLYQLYKLKA